MREKEAASNQRGKDRDEQHHLPQNETLLQTFEWYSCDTSQGVCGIDSQNGVVNLSHWSNLTGMLFEFSKFGISSLWLPPACKGQSPNDVGYGIYDLYDLGEFNTKGSIATRWGTKRQLQVLCAKARELGMGVVFDAVLNHRAAPDGTEICEAVEVDSNDRNIEIGKPHLIQAYTQFNYEARAGMYSSLKYDKTHFSGVDYDASTQSNRIFKLTGPDKYGWAPDVDDENGNYDYLMFADVDYGNGEVQDDVLRWGAWLRAQLPGLTGMRLDAIKHYSRQFQDNFIHHVNNSGPSDLFWVGEYWRGDSNFLSKHIDKFTAKLHLFDVKLVYNFHEASFGRIRDLRKVLQDTLVTLRPDHAVTFVSNHDTQEGQSLAAPIQPWFVPHAYAFILLRESGHPCVFWGDIFGMRGPFPRPPSCDRRLVRLMMARKLYAYGKQIDYFDEPTCVAWLRGGHPSQSKGTGLLVLLSINSAQRLKRICIGRKYAGEVWIDLMGRMKSEVVINRKGYGNFVVNAHSVGVWVRKGSPGQAMVSDLVYPIV